MTQEEAIQRLNLHVDLIPVGASNRPGTHITPTHITIHNTANPSKGADAAMHAAYVKGPDARARQVSWHFTVDEHQVYKHLPTNEKGWHAGGGNAKSIGIEVCENKGSDAEATADRAALLTALMMLAYGVPRERVVPHQAWTGKDCPRVLLRAPGGFDAFRDRAVEYLKQFQPAVAPEIRSFAMSPDESAGFDAPRDDLGTLADLHEPASAALRDDRAARLERLVGQLTLENHELRAALEQAQRVALDVELEAD
jgi:N-acetylmuramoyl-L-alanine amidase